MPPPKGNAAPRVAPILVFGKTGAVTSVPIGFDNLSERSGILLIIPMPVLTDLIRVRAAGLYKTAV